MQKLKALKIHELSERTVKNTVSLHEISSEGKTQPGVCVRSYTVRGREIERFSSHRRIIHFSGGWRRRRKGLGNIRAIGVDGEEEADVAAALEKSGLTGGGDGGGGGSDEGAAAAGGGGE